MQSNDQNDDTVSSAQLAPGAMVSHYRILERIGAGGMGEVYLAEDTKLNRKVALKFLPASLCHDVECRARFTREAQAAAKLGHANIVAVYEVGEYHDRPFFAMELVEGCSLDKLIAEDQLDESKVIELALGICNGLRKAHESGVVHRDIKPSNIFVDHDNVPRVLDFGLATIHDVEGITQTGSTLGTIGYMSPEQVSGWVADARSDLFSLGVVLYELATGINPFRRANHVATLKAICDDAPAPLKQHRAAVSDELARIIDKLLAKNPDLRYQTASDLASDLRRMSGPATIGHHRRSSRIFVIFGGIVVVIGSVTVAYFVSRSPRSDDARKTLAVLPFENLSPDPDQEFFSDGLTEELTGKLSSIQSLCVTSRSTSMTFKGSHKTVPEIARVLKVRYLVEGSVRRAGNQIRVSAQLIDADADAHLWTNTYNGTLSDVFNMQDSISRGIVEGIKIKLTPEETRRIGKRSIDNPLAYEYYLRGYDKIRKGGRTDVESGINDLKQGLAIVGDNPLIFSGLSWGCWNLVNGGFEQDQGIAVAQEYAQKALKLDPSLPEAHAMLGWISTTFLGKQRDAVAHFKKALQVDSANESAIRGLMVVYMYCAGRPLDASKLIQRYQRMYPLDSVTRFGQPADLSYSTGDFVTALEGYRKQRLTGYRNPVNELSYAVTLAYVGNTPEALLVIDSCLAANPSGSIGSIVHVMRQCLLKDKTGALRELTPEARRTCWRDAAWSYYLGSLLASTTANDEALDWLTNAAEKGCVNYPFWQIDPFLKSLRNDTRFQKLLARVKYEWEHFEA